ncbi:unnamed protein product [Nyctereutes procyonoides]|uniref:(raccoon dog) hypothetical protein n=1 Tax=Nyctereutes procyonoides TaxID=34880 RepID=A0A811Y130_NYCPR|nr:unnamed protein product [Nyctereutes procyonoides]
MMCEFGAIRHTSGSWQFGFNGWITYLFDSENRKWTVVLRAGSRQVLVHWDEMPGTVVPLTTPQGMAQSRASAIRPGTRVFPLFLSCAIIIGIQVRVL